jgi:hypothetical protein
MASGEGFVSTGEEAARSLGVTVQHVRRLADSGDLTRIARGLIDRTPIERYAAQGQGGRTRVWAEHTAWGAIALLTDMHADWLGAAQASRVRTTLRGLTGTPQLVSRTRDRAAVRIYADHSSVLCRMHLVRTDSSALGLVRSTSARIDGYLAADDLDGTVERLGLREDWGGNITLRSTGFDPGRCEGRGRLECRPRGPGRGHLPRPARARSRGARLG